MSATTKNLSIAEEIKAEVESEVEIEGKLIENINIEEPKELTDEEKHAKFVQAIKQSHLRYKPKKQFNAAYKQKRKAKNRAASKSRKNNK